MNRHLLYIAFWFPPSRASGVHRAIATAKGFVDSGWCVTVVTTSSEFLADEVGSIDESLAIPPGVDVVRVPFTLDTNGELDIRSLGRLAANLPTLRSVLERKAAPLREVAGVLQGRSSEAHQISDNYVGWIDPVVKSGRKIDSARPVDHILATGNPFSSFEAARLLAGMLGIGYTVDYRDPWTIDVFTGDTDITDRRTVEAERRIVAEAATCIHVNEAIADAYRKRYPESKDKHIVAHNGYDFESLPEPSGPSSSPLRFGILGTMNHRWPTDAIFKAWSAYRQSFPDGSELVLAGHLGYFARSEDLLEAYLPQEAEGFRYLGPVAKSKVADFYDALDVVILPVPDGPMVTSGKVFEVMALGKPFVCVQKAGGGARRLVEGHPLAFTAEPDSASVKRALASAAEAAMGLDIASSKEARMWAASFERGLAVERIVQTVTERTPTGRPA